MRILMRGLLSVFLNALALMIVAYLFDSFFLEDFETALLASLILSILNLFVKPILIIFTLPITVVTFGLFLFVVNAITLMLTQSFMGDAFVIDSFGMAVIGAIVISLISMVLNNIVKGTRR